MPYNRRHIFYSDNKKLMELPPLIPESKFSEFNNGLPSMMSGKTLKITPSRIDHVESENFHLSEKTFKEEIHL